MTDTGVAAVLWSSVSSGLTLACIRTHGQEEAAATELEAERRRHEVRLQALTGVPVGDPWSCARTHLDLDARSGLCPEAVEDADGRVWMRYRTPHWSGFGTAGPPATPAAFGPAIGAAQYRARHGTTAALVGGPLVEFVHTHDLTDGDPCDAGYFAAAAHPLSRDEHYRRERGARLPSFPPRAAGRVGSEPRSPWVDAAVWRMVVLAERLGIVGATAVIEHALRTVFTAVGGRLPELLGLPPVRTPLAAAGFYAATAATVGDDVELCQRDGHVVASSTSDRLWDGHPNAPAAVRDIVVRAWSAALPHHEWDLRARLIPSGEGSRAILFDRAS